MKLICESYGIELELEESTTTVLSIEDPSLFSNFVSGLWNQSNGIESGFLLSNHGSAIDIGKKTEMLISPLMASANNKKVITKLYQEIGQIADEYYYEETARINQSIVSYLDKITKHMPYPMEFNLDMKSIDLFKLYNVSLDENGTLTERLLSYIRAFHQICSVSVFIILNIKQFISRNQLEELYRTLLYEKVYLLLVEGNYHGCYDNERNYIVDKDCCIINVSE